MPDLFTLIFLPYHIAQITLAGIHAYPFFLRVVSQASMSLMAYLPSYNTRHKIAPDNGTENKIVHFKGLQESAKRREIFDWLLEKKLKHQFASVKQMNWHWHYTDILNKLCQIDPQNPS